MRAVKQGDNQYCGPAVLSVLTGKSTDECASVLTAVTGRYRIEEISVSELKSALRRMRYTFDTMFTDESMFSVFHRIYNNPGFYILVVPKHVVAIEVTENQKVWLCDNHTKEPLNGAASARLGQRVIECCKVELRPEPKFLRTEIQLTVNDTQYVSLKKIVVNVAMWDIYENEEDNQAREVGRLIVRDASELKLIRDEMLKRF